MELSTIVTCPNCNMRVFPKTDGTCPSCQSIIQPKTDPLPETNIENIEMEADASKTAKKERTQTKKRTPVYYGISGCALGFIIMVIFVTVAMLMGFSGQMYGTILNVGSWVLPIGLGVLGYFYGKSKQTEFLGKSLDSSGNHLPTSKDIPIPTSQSMGQKTKNGKDMTSNMAKCDICIRTITEQERFLLSTKEVATSIESWKRWLSKFNLPKLLTDGTSVNFVTLFFPPNTYIPIPDAQTSLLLFLVAKRASSDTPWLICKNCSNMFSFDHSVAKVNAMKWATTGEPSNGFALCKISQEGRTAIIEAIDSEAFQAATNAALTAVK